MLSITLKNFFLLFADVFTKYFFLIQQSYPAHIDFTHDSE
jgi:hypothetical protein